MSSRHTVGEPGMLLVGLLVELQYVCEGKFSWELQRLWPVLTNAACLPHMLIREKAWCRNEWECCIVKDISVPLHTQSSEDWIYGRVNGRVHPEMKILHYFLTLMSFPTHRLWVFFCGTQKLHFDKSSRSSFPNILGTF